MKFLKEKNLLSLTIAQFISLFGDRLNNMALLGILGSYYAKSTFAFSGLAIFIALPSILFSPISGIIADKLNRKKLMITIEILRALIVASIPLAFLHLKNILIIYSLIFLLYTLTLIFNNAKMAVIPRIVNNVYTANALLNITGRISIALGILFGGFIVDLYIWKEMGFEGWDVAFYIDAITYLISAALIALIVVKDNHYERIEISELIKEEENFFKRIWQDFKFGFEYISSDKQVSLVFKCLAITMLIVSMGYNIYLPYFQQSLGFGTKGIGLIGGILGAGFIIGSILFPIFAQKFGEIKIILFSHFLFPAIFIVSVIVKSLIILLLLFLISGFTLSLLLMSYDTFLQRNCDNSIAGRLFSFKEFIWSFSFLFFVFSLGILGEFLKFFFQFEIVVRLIIVIISALILVFNGILLFSKK